MEKKVKNLLFLLIVNTILAIFVIVFALTLHLVSNSIKNSYEKGEGGFVNCCGLVVHGSLIYDLILFLLIGFQIFVIIMILINGIKKIIEEVIK